MEVIDRLRQLAKEDRAWFITPNTVSSKNSKEIGTIPALISTCCNASVEKVEKSTRVCVECGTKYNVGICNKCGKLSPRVMRTQLRNSSKVQEYIDLTAKSYASHRLSFYTAIQAMPKPIYLGLYFIRESNNAWDMNNISQIVCDMIKGDTKKGILGWVQDDCTREVIPVYLGEHVAPVVDVRKKDKDQVAKERKDREDNKCGVIITVLNEQYKKDLVNYL